MYQLYKWRPSKWLLWSPVMAGLPLLAAGWITTPTLWKDVDKRASEAIKAASSLEIELDGRDATIVGDAESQEQLDAAIKTVAGTYGVRRVDAKAAIAPPVTLLTPTMDTLETSDSTPTISGTWPEGVATTLAVTVAGKTYELGKDASLKSAGGKWTLDLPEPVADGAFDVSIVVTDGKKASAEAKSPAALIVDTKPPEEPKLAAPAAGATWPYAISGAWPEADTTSLQFELNGKSYTLGKDPELTSDGKGTFAFAPKVDLAPGTYDLKSTLIDKLGNEKSYVIAKAIVIPEPPKTPEPPPPEPVKLAAPTIDNLVTSDSTPSISGTWPEGPATGLKVTLGNKSYELGKDKELTSQAGRWTLALPVAVPDASYDVSVIASNGAQTSAPASAPAGLIVDTIPPAAPKLSAPATDAKWPYAIAGTWPEADAASLKVEFNGKTYALGEAPELKSDGKGNFSFDPRIDLPPGEYDLKATMADKLGNVSDFTIPKAVIITAPEPAPPPPPPQMDRPTVDSVESTDGLPVIAGTWPAKTATGFKVDVGGVTYERGKASNLIANDSGKWTLKLDTPLKNGTYNVEAVATGPDQISMSDASSGEVIVKIPPPPPKPLDSPRVNSLKSSDGLPIISGTWPADMATGLQVEVAGKVYEIGKDKNLVTETSGQWLLTLDTPLQNGTYDVVATVTNAENVKATDTTSGEVTVDIPPPPPPPPKPLDPPTVDAVQSTDGLPTIRGTWPATMASKFKVEVAGKIFESGTSPNLVTDATGTWSLKLAAPLEDGTYDVVATAINAENATATDATNGELVVKIPPPPPPPKEEPKVVEQKPYDCIGTLNTIARVFPVRFEFDKADLVEPFSRSVGQFAALLKDVRCASLKVEIAGHADFRGRQAYNQVLSERRAQKVLEALTAAGIDGARLSTKGYSENQPIDPARTDEARSKNRRVEFTATE